MTTTCTNCGNRFDETRETAARGAGPFRCPHCGEKHFPADVEEPSQPATDGAGLDLAGLIDADVVEVHIHHHYHGDAPNVEADHPPTD